MKIKTKIKQTRGFIEIAPIMRRSPKFRAKETQQLNHEPVTRLLNLGIIHVILLYLRMYAPHVFCFLRRFCAAQGANARACTGYLSFHTLASEKR